MSVKKCPTCQGAMKEDAPECPWCAKGGVADMGEVERESMLEWPSRAVMMLVGTGLICFIIAAFMREPEGAGPLAIGGNWTKHFLVSIGGTALFVAFKIYRKNR